MFKKLHLSLTLLCGLITTCILWTMSALFLLVSENSQWENGFLSFQTDMNSLLASLEGQSTLSHSWLKKMENGKYRIYLTDNGSPLLFNELTANQKERSLVEAALSHYEENEVQQSAPSSFRSLHTEFSWSAPKNAEASLPSSTHFISCMSWLSGKVPITAVVLADQTQLRSRLRLQRILFLVIDLSGAALFFAFSWLFTGRLLKPVQENQQRQIDFIASASHELRTPLSVILASIQACELAPVDEYPRFFANIRREGKRMQGLLNDLLFLANDQSGQSRLQKTPTDLETLLLNQFENFEPLARQKEISLTITLPNRQLPSCTCDAEKIAQLLSIFLQNALSYTPTGGAVSLSAQTDGKTMRLSVADTGIGIPDAEKKRIFERFYRAEKSRSQKNHFGLGLCIAADIARAHRGHIEVSDNQPQGSVFTLVLPASPLPGRGMSPAP